MADREEMTPVQAVEGIDSADGERIEASRISLTAAANEQMNQLLEAAGYPRASMDPYCFQDAESKELYFRFFEESPASKAKTVLIAKVHPEHWKLRG